VIHKVLLTLLVAASFGAAVPAAGESLPVVPRDIRVGGVEVGGLISVQARQKLQRRFAAPVELYFADDAWRVAPGRLGASAAIGDAVAKALESKPGSAVPLRITVRQRAVRRFVQRLDKQIARPAVDAKLVGLAELAPHFTQAKAGRRVDQPLMVRRITRALESSYRSARLQVAVVPVQPDASADDFPVIVIRRGSNRLYLYNGPALVRTFTVATGQAQYPTPVGDWHIVIKERDPTWNPPDSDWAKDAEPIPPGPGNPLGTRWMGLDAAAVGIHGTPDAASLGYSASHGCIRMAIPEAEWLFEHVELGTPVYIVSA